MDYTTYTTKRATLLKKLRKLELTAQDFPKLRNGITEPETGQAFADQIEHMEEILETANSA